MISLISKFKTFLILIFALLISGFGLITKECLSQTFNPDYVKFKPFKMAFIPDIHMAFDKKDDWILYNESLVIFQDVIKIINKTENLNFMVLGGDLTENSDKSLSDLPMILDALNDTKIPYYTILGDRDSDLSEELTKQDFCSEFRRNGFLDKENTYWAVEPATNVLLIGLDSSIQNKSTGMLSPDQLVWLEQTLKSNRDKFTIITMHHSPIAFTGQDTAQNYVISDSAEFLNIIRKYPQVRLVLSGHHHINSTKQVGKTLFMSSPSIITYPNQFKILTVYPDKLIVDNKRINFKQLVSKAKRTITNTEYAKQYNLPPKKFMEIQEGDDFSKQKSYLFQ